MTGPVPRDVSSATQRRPVVIGVGNPFRRDDGVGEAVVRRLEAQATGRPPNHVHTMALDGEPVRLLDAWDGAALAVIVDAVMVDPVRSGLQPGTVQRMDVTPRSAGDVTGGFPGSRPLSGHAAGVGEAVALGACLDRLPGRLAIYTVVGADFGHGPGLSPGVAAAVDPLARSIMALVQP
jgi:hydrogenase maturation protease